MKKLFVITLLAALLLASCQSVPPAPAETKKTDQLITQVTAQNAGEALLNDEAARHADNLAEKIAALNAPDPVKAALKTENDATRDALTTQRQLITAQKEALTALTAQHEQDNQRFGSAIADRDQKIKSLNDAVSGWRKLSFVLLCVVVAFVVFTLIKLKII